VVAEVPFPFSTASQLIDPILEKVSSRTKLVLLDYVTSQTGVIMPLPSILSELRARGIETLVDGAHAPGMIPLNLKELGATYFTGNCHKWLCAPKGAALLYVQRDRQQLIRPLAISHGANSTRQDRSRFLIEFGWTGTCDPSAFLSVAETLRYMSSLLPGGWPAIQARNHALAIATRNLLCATLQTPPPCPDEFVGSLATVSLPDDGRDERPLLPWNEYPLQNRLLERHGIEVPIFSWPTAPQRLVRVAAQLYNSLPQMENLAEALVAELQPSPAAVPRG
jgi:isopenicillin-N epimerase